MWMLLLSPILSVILQVARNYFRSHDVLCDRLYAGLRAVMGWAGVIWIIVG